MRFSVVTPNLNMARYLPETIESVLRNLEGGDEYVVVDGGSTDGSVDILRQYSKRLSGWISEPDSGYADAVAKGFTRTTGELMCWVDSGDLLLDGALRSARGAIASTGADLVFGDDLHIDEEGAVIAHSRADVHSLSLVMLYGGWTPLQDACFWRRSMYDRIGGLEVTLRRAADYDFFLRASLSGRCVYTPNIYSAFRRHNGQTSVADAGGYKAERQACRRRELARQNTNGIARISLLLAAWGSIRWRHHITRHLRRGTIPKGVPVRGLSVIKAQ